MAIGNSYLTSVRQYMRLTTKAHDSEIKDLINAARADLTLGGVLEVKSTVSRKTLSRGLGRGKSSALSTTRTRLTSVPVS